MSKLIPICVPADLEDKIRDLARESEMTISTTCASLLSIAVHDLRFSAKIPMETGSPIRTLQVITPNLVADHLEKVARELGVTPSRVGYSFIARLFDTSYWSPSMVRKFHPIPEKNKTYGDRKRRV